jgi:hypothetical protein
VADFLLLLLDFEGAYILFKFPLYYSVVVLSILEGDFCLLLQVSELVKVLEDQVLHSLLIDFDLYFMFFIEILEFALFVTQFCLLIF